MKEKKTTVTFQNQLEQSYCHSLWNKSKEVPNPFYMKSGRMLLMFSFQNNMYQKINKAVPTDKQALWMDLRRFNK